MYLPPILKRDFPVIPRKTIVIYFTFCQHRIWHYQECWIFHPSSWNFISFSLYKERNKLKTFSRFASGNLSLQDSRFRIANWFVWKIRSRWRIFFLYCCHILERLWASAFLFKFFGDFLILVATLIILFLRVYFLPRFCTFLNQCDVVVSIKKDVRRFLRPSIICYLEIIKKKYLSSLSRIYQPEKRSYSG